MAAVRETFSAAALQRQRKCLDEALSLPEDHTEHMPEGFSISPVDPMGVLPYLDALRLKKGHVLRAYQFVSGGNGNGFVYALPEDSSFPLPQECPAVPTEVVPGVELPQPCPPGALTDIMSAFEGDDSAWSYMEASLLQRALGEFGAMWHGCEWGTHEIVDRNPVATASATKRSERGFGGPADWRWETQQPKEWRPSVSRTRAGIRVRFITVSGLGSYGFYEHTDRFKRHSYCAATHRRVLAWGPGGYVF